MAKKGGKLRKAKRKPTQQRKIPGWLKGHIPDIYALQKSNSALRRKILQNAPDKLIHVLCQGAHDVLLKKIPLSPSHCKRLKPHKKKILNLLRPGKNITQRRKILVQNGGFVGTLTAGLISALPALISLFQK